MEQVKDKVMNFIGDKKRKDGFTMYLWIKITRLSDRMDMGEGTLREKKYSAINSDFWLRSLSGW